jgi:hypothetical protein
MRIPLAIAALGLTAPILADTPAAAPPAPKPVKEKRICRQEQVIGSVIPAHICLTKAQWIEFEKHYEDVDQSFLERRKDQFNAIQKPAGSP